MSTVITAIMAFIGTNIDDIFVLMLFFAGETSAKKRRAIILGQYLGIGLLVAVSLICAYVLKFVPQKFIAVLGIIPIILGVKEIAENIRLRSKYISGSEDETSVQSPMKNGTPTALQVMLVSVSGGADNLGVYIPLFAGLSGIQAVITVSVFALMVGLWCAFGYKLSELPVIRNLIQKYKHILVPAVFILLGIFIIVENLI